MTVKSSRREAIQVGAFFMGGLVVGCRTRLESSGLSSERSFAFSSWIQITENSEVLVALPRVEMGQGTSTLFATIVAEELNMPVEDVKVITDTPINRDFSIALEIEGLAIEPIQMQMTGASSSTSFTMKTLPPLAATAREQLITAYMRRHRVLNRRNVTVENGQVSAPGRKSTPIGSLARDAAKVKMRLAEAKNSNYRHIGSRETRRVDIVDKVKGKTLYAYDFRAGSIANAVVKHCPILGGSVRSMANQREVERDFGVRIHTYPRLDRTVGVGIVGSNYWICQQASKSLQVEWEGGLQNVSSDSIQRKLESEIQKRKLPIRGARKKSIVTPSSATYTLPYVPHAALEPLSCAASVTGKRVDVWVGTQLIMAVRERVHALLKIPKRNITVHNLDFGGAFGRRLTHEFIDDAIQLAKITREPVKVMWSREDEFLKDTYRPASLHRIEGQAQGNQLVGWHHQSASPSVVGDVAPDFTQAVVSALPNSFTLNQFLEAVLNRSGLDPTSTEGARAMPYEVVDNQVKVEHRGVDLDIPVGFWRSVGHSFNAFVVESYIDELILEQGWDQYESRRRLLANHPRHLGVLDLAHQRAPRAKGSPYGRGYAVHESFSTYVAVVVDTKIEGDRIIVDHVTVAVDCGFVVNPDIVGAQMEGGVVWGLSAALKQEITFESGVPQQSNFHESDVLRMFECPSISVHIVPSNERPRGVGEPGVPPTAPALANAVARASGGGRARSLPIRIDQLRRG